MDGAFDDDAVAGLVVLFDGAVDAVEVLELDVVVAAVCDFVDEADFCVPAFWVVEPPVVAAGALLEAGAVDGAVPEVELVCCVWPAAGAVAELALGRYTGPRTIALAAHSATRRCAQRRAGLDPCLWRGTTMARRVAVLWRPSSCPAFIALSCCPKVIGPIQSWLALRRSRTRCALKGSVPTRSRRSRWSSPCLSSRLTADRP